MQKVNLWVNENGFVEGWSREDCTEENEHVIGYYMQEDDPFFQNYMCYRIVDGVLTYDETNLIKRNAPRKINALKEECSQRIVNGFEFMGYQFGFSTSDQSNITSTMMAMQMGIITEIEWTVRTMENETARVILNADQFKEMCQIALAHKDNCIKHLRNVLEPKINACTTLEELNKITWEEEE